MSYVTARRVDVIYATTASTLVRALFGARAPDLQCVLLEGSLGYNQEGRKKGYEGKEGRKRERESRNYSE